jgi:hypothetical protein
MALPKEEFKKKMAEGRAKAAAAKALSNTQPINSTIPVVANNSNGGNGNGHTDASVATDTRRPLAPHSWDSAYHQQDQPSSLKPLFEAGDNPIDLLMRSILGNLGTDEYILMVALAEEMSKCREVGDTEGEKEVRDMFAMMPSIKGQAREQYVSAIIGEFYHSAVKKEGGFSNKLHDLAQNGFNNNKDGDGK